MLVNHTEGATLHLPNLCSQLTVTGDDDLDRKAPFAASPDL